MPCRASFLIHCSPLTPLHTLYTSYRTHTHIYMYTYISHTASFHVTREVDMLNEKHAVFCTAPLPDSNHLLQLCYAKCLHSDTRKIFISFCHYRCCCHCHVPACYTCIVLSRDTVCGIASFFKGSLTAGSWQLSTLDVLIMAIHCAQHKTCVPIGIDWWDILHQDNRLNTLQK